MLRDWLDFGMMGGRNDLTLFYSLAVVGGGVARLMR